MEHEMIYGLLLADLLFLGWCLFMLLRTSSPEVCEVRTFPDVESHAASNDSPQEAQGESLQGQRG